VARPVVDHEVAAWLPAIEDIARRFSGVGGAEYDDLRQEGMIAVFMLLRRDLPPSRTAIKNRCRDWIRVCRRQV
jgi:DNA-directed RNA polymerase specialized sigma24 family protein